MRRSEESSILNQDNNSLKVAADKKVRRYKRHSYYEIFAASSMNEKSKKLIDYLSRDDVDPASDNDFEKISKAMFQKNSFIHIMSAEIICKSMDEIILSSVDPNQRDMVTYHKYLKVLNKLSIFFKEKSDFYVDQLIDEIKRVVSEETITSIIEALPDDVRLILITKLLATPYWRNAIPKLELYDTFS